MDRLWSPWRFQYVSRGEPSPLCIFCEKGSAAADPQNLVIARGELNFVLLNIFPYTNGHLMIAPYQHVATLEEADDAVLVEMARMARRAEICLRSVYNAPGMNLGMNVGECAGAGVAGHIHLHVLPRWPGDANFMTTIGETRVMPESLLETWEKLTKAWVAGGSGSVNKSRTAS